MNYGRGRQQADRGPDPDPDADLYGPGPIINTLTLLLRFGSKVTELLLFHKYCVFHPIASIPYVILHTRPLNIYT